LGVGISADLANCLSFYFGLNYMRSENLSISAAGLLGAKLLWTTNKSIFVANAFSAPSVYGRKIKTIS